MTDSSKVKPLLDFIGKVESSKGYNYEYGNKKLDLSNMTIKEVLEHQEKRRRENVTSSAVGRYQFIYKTLRDLVLTESGKEKNPKDLPLDAKFTPELQDKAATILLQRRGLDQYLAGTISPEVFSREIAKEWASMPLIEDTTVFRKNKEGQDVQVDLKKGQSYYSGVAGNKSLVNPDEFLDTVKKTQLQEIQVDPELIKKAADARTFVEALK
jgi:muramidase (phage lysozyme)